jgi:hypothetical protein
MAELRQEFSKVLKWLETRMMEELPPHPDHSEFDDNDWSTD